MTTRNRHRSQRHEPWALTRALKKMPQARIVLRDVTARLGGRSRFGRVVNEPFDPPLDEGIARYVQVLRAAGFETFESCEGGTGHACPEPMVRFHGEDFAGFRALGAAVAARLPVAELRRVWPVNHGRPIGPWWELVFFHRDG